jgi:hypothetical protein
LVLATFVALNLNNNEKIWKQQNFVYILVDSCAQKNPNIRIFKGYDQNMMKR